LSRDFSVMIETANFVSEGRSLSKEHLLFLANIHKGKKNLNFTVHVVAKVLIYDMGNNWRLFLL
jgi:hypothetical protein